ncbi:dihydroorotate dehydrogenase electron transfer subunit [Advenella mimigardefordensis]|uniref:Dihydroorotate dehydrogenase electron transfer subunit n=1 Tax=Advenella mimigardefordensis (strain DSM 17166 / LMG 22922 / DPN7) TaxID=1247726 RepID=W0PHI0_ADVMD|nr:dihydroorotate dehydrogenase electron transfer subunit [Advenella mimigardefordensis]AHG65232.1 dihydroorotate dehydrogenase electron transfer subunit [Advenella mimigardefordensis DPN7]
MKIETTFIADNSEWASQCSRQPDKLHFPITENPARILSNAWVNAEYKHMVVAGDAASLAAQPGQFFHLKCPGTEVDQPYLRRPMSLYGVNPSAGTVEFLYKVQGMGTRGLATLAEGDCLDMLGPLGRGFEIPDTTRHVLMVARGVGLATLTPLASAAIALGAKVTAMLSARSPELIMSKERLTGAGADVIAVSDTEGNSAVPELEALIRRLHAQTPVDFMTTCGSNRLLKLLQSLSKELGVTGQIAMEQHMGCAVGMCYACVRPFRQSADSEELSYRRVCWDGPVFPLEEALTW